MNKTLKIILGLSALAAGAALTAGAVILARNGKFDEIINIIKRKTESCSLTDSNDLTKANFKKIAKDLNRNIQETSKRISGDNHNKIQNEYDKMHWGIKLGNKKDLN